MSAQYQYGIATPAQIAGLSGREILQAIVDGRLPQAPISQTMTFWIVEVGDGFAAFEGEPGAHLLNPMGGVHGGWALTILDSVTGSAGFSTLPAGFGYTTVETKGNLTRDELTKRTAPFASGGGGKRYLVAIAASERGGAYGFHHWGGFWTTAALDDAVITRPDPPLLLVLNHPHDRESKDQNATEEIVRWRDDGSFVATGARYSKWDLGQSTDDFAKTAARLLVGTKR